MRPLKRLVVGEYDRTRKMWSIGDGVWASPATIVSLGLKPWYHANTGVPIGMVYWYTEDDMLRVQELNDYMREVHL